MSFNIPPGIAYGRITGQMIKSIKDGPDEGDEPDVAQVSGSITFTPEVVGAIKYPDSKVLVFPEPISLRVDTFGAFDIKLLATDIGNPVDWTWRVTFNITNFVIQPFSITVPGGSETDLYDLMPAGSSNGVLTLRGPAGPSNYERAVALGFVGTESQYMNSLKGGQGDEGDDAYEVAVADGFSGSRTDWLVSLIGPKGNDAYQVAVAEGFAGSRAMWLLSLVGPEGDDAYEVAVGQGFSGDRAAWIASLRGEQGFDAYEVAVAEGFSGSRAAWLLSLKGDEGDPGQNIYEFAVAQGFVGTEAEYLASIKGDTGDSNYEIAVRNGYVGTEAEWIESVRGVPGVGVPEGGFAYQILAKETNDNYDTYWADIPVEQVVPNSQPALRSLGGQAYQAAPGNHNHNGVYSTVDHNHDGTYAPLNHNHDSVYAPVNHNHDALYTRRANNLSDLANAVTARANLGLGDAAVRGVGTASGTVAAGNDTRITGALQKDDNLNSLVNKGTSRTNLGLGSAAVLDAGSSQSNVPVLGTFGVLPSATLGTGTKDATTWLRGDSTFAVIPYRSITHGSTANTARPAADKVQWVGSVEPTNAINNDEWVKTV